MRRGKSLSGRASGVGGLVDVVKRSLAAARVPLSSGVVSSRSAGKEEHLINHKLGFYTHSLNALPAHAIHAR
jgi:hypothetical protein